MQFRGPKLQPLAEIRMRERNECAGARPDGFAVQIGGAIFGHNINKAPMAR